MSIHVKCLKQGLAVSEPNRSVLGVFFLIVGFGLFFFSVVQHGLWDLH